MDAGLFIFIMGGLSVFYLALGWTLSSKMKNRVDFFLAGRNLGTIPVTASLLATQIGGGMFIGTAQDPIRGILYVAGLVISFLVLGLGVSEKFRDFELENLPSIFEKKYHSLGLTRIAAFLSVVTLCGILVTQAVAMKTLINGLHGSNLDYIFPALWAVIIIYTILGGLQAVVTIDIVQILIVIGIFSAFFLKGIFTEQVNFFSEQTVTVLKDLIRIRHIPWAEVIHIVLVSTCYSIITQDIAHRLFAARNRSVASRSALYASVILFMFAIVPFYFGTKAYIIALQTGTKESLFEALAQVTSGPFLILAVCALMAAITSTVDSLLCAVSAVLCYLTSSFFPQKYEIHLSQIIITICGISIFISSYWVPQNIIKLLVESYQISVACLFVPIMVACFKPQSYLKKEAGYAAVFGGIAGLILSKIIFHTIFAAWTLPIALSLSFGLFSLTTYLTRRA